MISLLFSVFALLFSQAAAQDQRFENAELGEAARAYLSALDTRYADVSLPGGELMRRAAAAAETGAWRVVRVNVESLAHRNPDSYSIWLRLANAWRAADPQAEQGAAAAYRAFRLARSREEALEALFVLGDAAFEIWTDRSQKAAPGEDAWRGVSQRIFAEIGQLVGEDAELETRLAGLRRDALAIETQYPNEPRVNALDRAGAAPPPFCVTFTEKLAFEPAAAASKILINGEAAAPSAIEIDGRVLCVTGLEWGREYEVTFTPGVRAASGRALEESVSLSAFVPPAAPMIGFNRSDYVMLRNGDGAIEIKSMNIESADLTLYRVTDAEILRSIGAGEAPRAFKSSQFNAFKDAVGERVWRGALTIGGPANKDVTSIVRVGAILESWRNASRDAALRDGPLEPAGDYSFDVSRPDDADRFGPAAYALVVDDVAVRDDPSSNLAFISGFQWPVKWFVETDLGLTMAEGDDTVAVVARKLSTGAAAADARVELIAKNGRVLGAATADAAGAAVFPARLTRGADVSAFSAAAAYLDDDFGYLEASTSSIDLTDLDVAGRNQSGPVDAYVALDRGVYRPGEEIAALVLLRDASGDAIGAVPPITLEVISESGVTAVKQVVSAKGGEGPWRAGGAMVRITLPATAPIGPARLFARIPGVEKPLFEAPVHIAHFRPERATVTFDRAWTAEREGDQIAVSGGAFGEYLYGLARDDAEVKSSAPVDDSRVRAWASFDQAASPDPGCYAAFRFGDDRETVEPVTRQLGRALQTDEDGRVEIATRVDAPPASSRPIAMSVTLELFDEYGPIGRKAMDEPILTSRAQPWVGVRHVGDRVFDPAAPLAFDLVSLDGALARSAGGYLWTISKERIRYAWSGAIEGWDYQPSREMTPIADGLVFAPETDPLDDECVNPTRFSFTPGPNEALELGGYRMEITDLDGTLIASTRFALGGEPDFDGPNKPDLFSVSVSNTAPAVGDEITVTADSIAFDSGEVAFAFIRGGKAEVFRNAVIENGAATVVFEAPDGWDGAYVHVFAMAFSGAGEAKTTPTRAFGLGSLQVSDRVRRFDLAFTDVREDLAPNEASVVRVAADPASLGGEAYVALFAVDRGVRQITNHQIQDPAAHFHGRRGFGFDLKDLYARIIAESDGVRYGANGGDLFADFRGQGFTASKLAIQIGAPQKLVNGEAQFDLAPFDFTGLVDLTAIAWTAEKTGFAEERINVFGTLDLSVGAPAHAAPGDRLSIPVTLRNIERDVDTQFAMAITPRGVDLATGRRVEMRPLTVGRGETASMDVEIVVPDDAAGAATLDVIVVSTANQKEELRQRVTMRIAEIDAPVTTLHRLASLPPDRDLTVDRAVIEARVAGRSGRARLRVNSGSVLPALSLAGSDDANIRNARTVEAITALGVLRQVNAAQGDGAVARLAALQSADGGFLGNPLASAVAVTAPQPIGASQAVEDWIGGPLADSVWRSALALDYLLLSIDAGVRVDADLVAGAVGYISTGLRRRIDIAERRPDEYDACQSAQFFAALVLARANSLERRIYEDLKACAETPMSDVDAGMLGAFLLAYGDVSAANALIESHFTTDGALDQPGDAEQLRDLLMSLALLSENQAPQRAVDALIKRVARRTEAGAPMSIDVAAWLARASRSVGASFSGRSTLALEVNGRPVTSDKTAWESESFAAADPGSSFRIANKGAEPVDLFLELRGPSRAVAAPDETALALSFRMFDQDGREIGRDPDARLMRNELAVFVVEGYAPPGARSPLRLAAPVPSGFEIEVARIEQSLLASLLGGRIAAKGQVRFYEALPDRVLAIIEPVRDESAARFTYAFAARPTVAGRLTLPAAFAELVTTPAVRGATSSGMVEISTGRP
ncbi:MAG: hypothetical protein AAF360_03645 [Pseudomonadota bacterium]